VIRVLDSLERLGAVFAQCTIGSLRVNRAPRLFHSLYASDRTLLTSCRSLRTGSFVSTAAFAYGTQLSCSSPWRPPLRGNEWPAPPIPQARRGSREHAHMCQLAASGERVNGGSADGEEWRRDLRARRAGQGAQPSLAGGRAAWTPVGQIRRREVTLRRMGVGRIIGLNETQTDYR